MVEAGVDIVEVGLPYSDPSWTAPSSSAPPRRALPPAPASTTSSRPAAPSPTTGAPALVMTYWNPVAALRRRRLRPRPRRAGGARASSRPTSSPTRRPTGSPPATRTASTASSWSRPARPGAPRHATSPQPRLRLRRLDHGRHRRAGEVGAAAEALVARTPRGHRPARSASGSGSPRRAGRRGRRVRRRRHRRLGARPPLRRRRHSPTRASPSPGPRRRPRRRRPPQPRKGGDLLMAAPLCPLEIPSPTTGVWHLGPLPVRAYALCILAGIVVAVWMTQQRLGRARRASRRQVLDISAWAVPVRHRRRPDLPRHHLARRPYFGEGGEPVDALQDLGGRPRHLGRHRARRRRRLDRLPAPGGPLPRFGDAAAPGILVAQAIGRFGNCFNNELYGRPTDLPWGLEVYEWDQAAGHAVLDANGNPVVLGVFHPTFLYEAIWCLAARGPARSGWTAGHDSATARSSRCTSWLHRRPRLDRRAHAHRRRRTTSSGCGSTLDVDPGRSLGWAVFLYSWFGRRHRPDRTTPERRSDSERTRETGRISTIRNERRRTWDADATDVLSTALADAAQSPLTPTGPLTQRWRVRVICPSRLRSVVRPAANVRTVTMTDVARPRRLFAAQPDDSGLYDREYEHDACGVALRRHHARERRPRHRRRTPSPRCATSTTAAPSAPRPTAATAPASSRQIPDAFLREVVDFELPPRRRATPSASPSCPRTRPSAPRRQAGRGDRRRGGPRRSSAGATSPIDRRPRRRQAARDCMPHFRQLFVASAAGRQSGVDLDRVRLLPAQARRARDRRLLRVAVVAHPGLQGHAHHRPARAVLPRPVATRASRPSSRWSTRGSRRTRSRRGRSRTRSGSSRTTARSTPSRATATGCAPARAS